MKFFYAVQANEAVTSFRQLVGIPNMICKFAEAFERDLASGAKEMAGRPCQFLFNTDGTPDVLGNVRSGEGWAN